ncbi:hypothetical protein [Pueribacillus sp. YX66]|uniref:hypothetical protein n=1 Tax=Pueribacillus sp. YX66 TaxID=3229242 RepID=UPI00358D84D8
MAFGITRSELSKWKYKVLQGEIAFLTHYWFDERFPEANTVTKVGCIDIERLIYWGKQYNLKDSWIDRRNAFPHFDLIGERQIFILKKEKQWDQIHRFQLIRQTWD